MSTLYFLSVWLHILAAMIWVGGMLFLVLVVVPWLRQGKTDAAVFLRETGQRFRNIGWLCFALLLLTGTFNLWVRGVRLTSFVDPAWLGSAFGKTVLVKLGVFALVLVVSASHDFVLGPLATRAIETDPSSATAQRLRRRASLLGRVNVVFAIVLVALGVMLVRGVP